jgi:hypothetical protein
MTLVRHRPSGQVAPAALSRSGAPRRDACEVRACALANLRRTARDRCRAARSARGPGEKEEMPLPARKPTIL